MLIAHSTLVTPMTSQCSTALAFTLICFYVDNSAQAHCLGMPCRYADPILDRLDPNRYIAYRLYRDSTQYVGGRHCRDLTKLNRDPARVLLVSADPDAYHLQPENAIKVRV